MLPQEVVETLKDEAFCCWACGGCMAAGITSMAIHARAARHKSCLQKFRALVNEGGNYDRSAREPRCGLCNCNAPDALRMETHFYEPRHQKALERGKKQREESMSKNIDASKQGFGAKKGRLHQRAASLMF